MMMMCLVLLVVVWIVLELGSVCRYWMLLSL